MKNKQSLSKLVCEIKKHKDLALKCEACSKDYWRHQDKIVILTREFNAARLELDVLYKQKAPSKRG